MPEECCILAPDSPFADGSGRLPDQGPRGRRRSAAESSHGHHVSAWVRDPVVLGARTRADNDIFYNEDAGLPRPERELAAAATSRTNGCTFCASVHSRFAAKLSGRGDDVQRLLDDGIDAPQDERWTAVIQAAAALTATPSRFDRTHVEALRAAGFGDQAIVDVIQSAAFFSWANRLMLSLGEPTAPIG